MSEQSNTSAKRLMGLIKRLDSVQGESVYHHFSKVFNNEDYDYIYGLVKRSRQLVSQYADDIKGLGNEDLYTVSVVALQNLFTPHHMSSSYSALRNQLPHDLITRLQFADRELSERGMEKEISQDVIREITKSVNELEQLVLASDLSPELKRVLTEYVALFRKALTEYQIIGVEAFKDAYGESVKIAVKNTEVLTKPEGQEAYKKLNKVIWYVRNAANFTVEHWDTIKDIGTLLLGTGG